MRDLINCRVPGLKSGVCGLPAVGCLTGEWTASVCEKHAAMAKPLGFGFRPYRRIETMGPVQLSGEARSLDAK